MKNFIEFIDWRKSLERIDKGGIIIYEIKGFYRYVSEGELYDYFMKNIYVKL